MVHQVLRSPKALLVLLFGTILGAVWAAGSAALAAPKPGGNSVSITAGDGIVATPNPITSAGTIAVSYGGNGAAKTVARSDHDHAAVYSPLGHNHDSVYSQLGHNHDSVYSQLGHNHDGVYSPVAHDHDARYLQLTGGTLNGSLTVNGNLTLGPGAQLIAPRVENAAIAPATPAPGQLWWNTTSQALEYYDGAHWQAIPTGAAASPILGVSTPSSQNSGTQVFGPTGASVTFTLPSQATVVIEFGAEFEILSSSQRGEMSIYPIVDGVSPQFTAQDSARFAEYSSNNNTSVTTQCSRLVTRLLTAGSHTVVLQASISSDQGATIRYPWLKATKQ
jgi:hypothetical protein